MATYNEDSIVKMDPRSFTRARSDVYCGSTEDSTQLVREIVANCIDENLAGNCTRIDVLYDLETHKITVIDNGQGILPDVWKDGRTVLEMVYGDINTSGKYNKGDDAVYKTSTGAFGIGASISNFLSKSFRATTRRNGKYETVWFIDGLFDKRETGTCDLNEHGVSITFLPDEQFFDDPCPNFDKLKKFFHHSVALCDNLTIYFNGTSYDKSLSMDSILSIDNELCENRFESHSDIGSQKLDMVMTVCDDSVSQIVPFCNYSEIEGGTPVTAIKTLIVKHFNKWGRESGVLKDNEKLSWNDIQEGVRIVFNLVSPNIRYDSQTKVRVTSTEDNKFINDFLSYDLVIWLNNNAQQSKSIIEKSLLAKRAAEAARKAREAVKEGKQKKNKVVKMPTKLIDCWTKNRKNAELFICEGLSAASILVSARDSETQSIYGVRGKMLSVLKTSPKNIMKNQEINNIVQALGLPCNVNTGKMLYEPNKLRYQRIIACADAE